MYKSRTVIKTAPEFGALDIETRSTPEVGPKDALLKIHRAAICGTDLHIYKWNDWAARNYKPPLVLGHEFCGEVLQVGRDVSTLTVGQRVAGETHLYCDACEQCRMNRRHTCLNLRLFSKSGFGCFSDYTVVPVQALRVVAPELPLEKAVVMEPLGVGVRAAMEADVSGKSIFVMGCGPIGLYVISAARALGASLIIASDVSAYRLALSQKVGADHALDASQDTTFADIRCLTNGLGVDVVIDATGSEAAIQGALDVVKPGGRLILAGLPNKKLEIDAAKYLINREITLKGIYGRLIDETWVATENLLMTNRIHIEDISTHEFSLDNFTDAFETSASGKAGKVQFNMDL